MDNLFDLKTQKALIAKNTKSAKDFISQILDDKSFVEMDAFLYTQNELLTEDTVSEGVVSGYGTMNGNPVYIYCQNYDILKGGLGKSGAAKILKCMDAAEKSGTPIVSVLHTQGTRLGEGITSLDAYAQIIAKTIALNGVIPQIAIIKGECFGHMSYLAALSDFVYMLDGAILVSGAPAVISAKSNMTITAKELGGSKVQSEQTGICSFAVKNAADAKASIIKLLELILNDQEACIDELNRQIKATKYDGKKLVEEILDKGSYMELNAGFANVYTYIGRLNGNSVAVVASSNDKDTLKVADLKKLTSFIRFADIYGLPVISFVNTKGIAPCVECEQRGVVVEMARLMSAVSECSTQKISIVCGAAIGTGYTALASKKMGFDYALAWENAVISPIAANVGAATFYQDQITEAKNSEKVREKLEKQYAEINSSPVLAAADGCIDNIIAPANTRTYLISILQMLA